MAAISLPTKTSPSRAARLAESAFWLVSGALIFVWALTLAADLIPGLEAATAAQTFLLRHSGASALLISLLLLTLVSVVASLLALRSKSIPQPSASMLVVTAAALRAIQILSDSSVSMVDAEILGGLSLAAAILYYGPMRLWWALLLPAATAASLTPLIWLEFFKGLPSRSLVEALIAPVAAFIVGSIIVIARDLRGRGAANISELHQLKNRSETTMQTLRSMEADMKTLTVTLSHVGLAPFRELEGNGTLTTEFIPAGREVTASETCSFDEIDTMARQVLDDARASIQGSPMRLTLTAPSEGGLPIAVRGDLSTVYVWLKSAVAQSLDALGGFPNGVVRVNLRPGLASIVISIEDNGRGIGEGPLGKQGRIEGRMAFGEIRSGVEALGGRFDLQSRLGVGARVTIELPRIDAFATLPRAHRATVVAAPATADFDPSMSNSPRA